MSISGGIMSANAGAIVCDLPSTSYEFVWYPKGVMEQKGLYTVRIRQISNCRSTFYWCLGVSVDGNVIHSSTGSVETAPGYVAHSATFEIPSGPEPSCFI